jgi:hypothetical protein
MGRDGKRLPRAFQLCQEVAQAYYRGRALEDKRGHPWPYGWDLYLTPLFRTYREATYRHTVELYRELFPHRPLFLLESPSTASPRG